MYFYVARIAISYEKQLILLKFIEPFSCKLMKQFQYLLIFFLATLTLKKTKKKNIYTLLHFLFLYLAEKLISSLVFAETLKNILLKSLK